MHNIRGFLVSGIVAAIALAGAVHPEATSAQSATSDAELQDIAARYGARASVLSISLSPSGNRLAWVAAGAQHTEVLKVVDLAAGSGVKTVISNTEIIGDLDYCDWVTEDRLLCQISGISKRNDGVLVPFDRLLAINWDGSDPKQISERRNIRALGFNQDGGSIVALDVAGEDGMVLITKNYVKEFSTGTRLANDKEGLGVDRLDIESGKRRSIERPDNIASRYIADENGDLRFKVRSLADSAGILTGERVFMYRDAGQKSWKRLENVSLDGQPIKAFAPVAVSAAKNSLYAYRSIDGYDAVIEIPLDGSNTAKSLVTRGDVDVDALIRIGRQRRVVGAAFATEKRSVEYFDPGLSKLAAGLTKALPNQPIINIVGANADESKLAIIASSDTDPGTVYLYDKSTRQLEQLLAMREFLVDQTMGKMTPVSYPAADGTEIPAYLTLPPDSSGKNLSAIVLPHGGPAARDYWGFDWLVQFFVARGYAVLQPNYRGSAGYGEAWFGKNGYQAWDVAIGDVNDAGRWLVSEGIADADKLAIAGWSYGGYAALQSQVVDADLYKAVVAIAPVTDLEFLRSDARAYTNFKFRDRQLGRGPHIAAGSPRRHADKFKAPVALFHGTRDLNVTDRHSKAMADALKDAQKQVQYREFEDLQHGLADSKARMEMLVEIDEFLAKALDK